MGTNTNVKASPNKYQVSVQKLIAGFNQAFPAKSTITVNGTAMSATQIVAKLQAIVDEYQAILDSRSTLKNDLQTAKTNRPTEHQLIMQLHGALVALFGPGNPQLLQFGFTPTKPKATKTAAEKAVTAAKAKATRDMRHTMGSVQKQSVKFGAQSTSVTIVNGKASIAAPSDAAGNANAPQGNPTTGGAPAPAIATPVAAANASAPSSDGSASASPGNTTKSGS